MKIIWSEKALQDFEQNIDYLFEEWNQDVVQDFTSETERILEILKETPKAFQKHKKTKVHIVPIVKQVTLFYDVKSSHIELLRFWNNYKNPRQIKLK
jgi:plasmid stabilization system protein ParE